MSLIFYKNQPVNLLWCPWFYPDFWRAIEARVARENTYHATEKERKAAAKAT